MILALLLAAAAAAPAQPPPQLSPEFVKACRDRATNDAEQSFCAAGEAAAKLEDAEEIACLNADYSQQGMNRCEGEAYERADKALNAVWAKIMAGEGDKDEDKLMLDAQRAWIKYREAYCEASAYSSQGGSIYPMLVSGCMANLTRLRTQELTATTEGN